MRTLKSRDTEKVFEICDLLKEQEGEVDGPVEVLCRPRAVEVWRYIML